MAGLSELGAKTCQRNPFSRSLVVLSTKRTPFPRAVTGVEARRSVHKKRGDEVSVSLVCGSEWRRYRIPHGELVKLGRAHIVPKVEVETNLTRADEDLATFCKQMFRPALNEARSEVP